MATERTWKGAEVWFDAVGDGAIGGLLSWSLMDLLGRWFGTPQLELSTLVLIGTVSTVLGRAVHRRTSSEP